MPQLRGNEPTLGLKTKNALQETKPKIHLIHKEIKNKFYIGFNLHTKNHL
jgi:hypothetical protein